MRDQAIRGGRTPDSTNAEFIGATFSLLATEAIARLLTYAEDDALDAAEQQRHTHPPRVREDAEDRRAQESFGARPLDPGLHLGSRELDQPVVLDA